MRNVLAGAMVITMALCVYAAAINFAAVTPEVAWPAYALALLLGVLWAGKLLAAKAVSWRFSVLHIPIAAFFVYALARYFFAPLEHEARLDLINIGFCALVYFVAAANFYRSRDREWFLWALLALAVGESIYGIYQFSSRAETMLGGYPRPDIYYSRGGGTFVCPNHLAGFLEIVLGLFLGRLVFQRASSLSVQQLALRKIALGYGAIILLGGLIATRSRGGWIATAVAVTSIIFWGGWQLRSLWIRVAIVLAGLGLLAGLILGISGTRDYVEITFHDPKNQNVVNDTTLGHRTLLWGATVEMIRDHPVFGIGGGSWEWVHLKLRHPLVQFRPEYAHNDILQFTAEYGLIGGLLLAGIIGCLFWQAVLVSGDRSSSDHRSFAIGAALGTTAILVHSWFDFGVHMPANAVLLAAIFGFTAAEEDGRFKRVEMGRARRYALGALVLAFCVTGAWFVAPACLSAQYNLLGNRARQLLQWDEAKAYYAKAIKSDPKNWEPYFEAAKLSLAQAEWMARSRLQEREQLIHAAITNCDRALVLNPLQSEVMLHLARAYENLQQNDAALQVYDRALKSDPNDAAIFACLGRFYRHTGNDSKAIEAFTRSHDLDCSYSNMISPVNLWDLKAPK